MNSIMLFLLTVSPCCIMSYSSVMKKKIKNKTHTRQSTSIDLRQTPLSNQNYINADYTFKRRILILILPNVYRCTARNTGY